MAAPKENKDRLIRTIYYMLKYLYSSLGLRCQGGIQGSGEKDESRGVGLDSTSDGAKASVRCYESGHVLGVGFRSAGFVPVSEFVLHTRCL
eukprot:1322612-Amorphochlora_amoeboformis.AAC.1